MSDRDLHWEKSFTHTHSRPADANPFATPQNVCPLAASPSLAATRHDSRPDTEAHIGQVREFLGVAISNLVQRAFVHDASKLSSPEVEVFDEFTPKLAGSTYGSDEYKSFLAAMKPALEYHYAHNSHHPEHYPNGIRGMSLLDVLEMLVDWKAATLRHNDGDIRKSVEINQGRFGYSDELKQILLNTLDELGL